MEERYGGGGEGGKPIVERLRGPRGIPHSPAAPLFSKPLDAPLPALHPPAMPRWPLRPRQPFSGLALAALLGIGFAEYLPIPVWPALSLAFLTGALVFWRPHTLLAWLFTAASFYTLHDLQHHHSEARLLADELGPNPQVATATGLVWSEPLEAKTPTRTSTGSFTLKAESLAVAGRTRPCDALVQVRWNGATPQYGDRVRILGSLQPLPPARNEGQFDYSAWQHRHGIYSELRAGYEVDCEILSHGHGPWTQTLAFAARHWVATRLEIDLRDSPDVYPLIESMILGLQGDTPEDVKELFQHTGTMHLFAVSGLNVAMLAAIAWWVLKPLRVRRRTAILIIIPLLAFYALITGLSASCLRACIMGGLVLAAYLFDRQPCPFNGIAAAAFAILAWDTNQLFSPGFQFSFVLVQVLLALGDPVGEKLAPLGQPDPFLPRPLRTHPQRAQALVCKWATMAVSVSTVSWVGSLVFTGWYFHLVSPVTVAANVLAVPISFVILILGVAALLLPPFTAVFNNANWACTKLLLFVVKIFAGVPCGYFYFSAPHLPTPEWEVAVLDVGSGGAAYVHASGADWMIDCAHGYEYDRVIRPFLRARGVNWLDGLILTHGDSQHIGGALPLLEEYHPALIIDSPLKDRSSSRRGLHSALEDRDTPKRILQRGDSLQLGPTLRADVLFPPAGLVRGAADDKAFVLRFDDGHTRVLLVSDSGFPTEQWLLENEPDLRAEVIVKGEHSKDLSGGPDFLRAVRPRLIVTASPDRYRPWDTRARWIRQVRATGIDVLPQEKSGEVRIRVGRDGFSATGFMDGQTVDSHQARPPLHRLERSRADVAEPPDPAGAAGSH
jgi:ComEC/Rec2-related protein